MKKRVLSLAVVAVFLFSGNVFAQNVVKKDLNTVEKGVKEETLDMETALKRDIQKVEDEAKVLDEGAEKNFKKGTTELKKEVKDDVKKVEGTKKDKDKKPECKKNKK